MVNSKKLAYCTLTVALSGFLFGFDTVVISGANQPIKELWQTGPIFHGFFIMSMALWGTVFGALLGGIPTDRLGRKKTLIILGILYALSAVWSALATDPYSFSIARFIGGLGVGASAITAPAYISEISPAIKRGKMVAWYQFMIVFGILIAFLSNYLLKGVSGANDWRWMVGVEAIPALFFTISILFVPESPRWLLVNKQDEAGAKKIMGELGLDHSDLELNTVASERKENLWSGKYKKPIILAFLIAFFNQLSGINFVLYYAPEILERAGLAAKESLFSSVSIGFVNLIFTIIGMNLIDKFGRRTLIIIGSFGYIISLSMVAFGFYSGQGANFMLAFICLFIGSHAVGQGAVIWVYISEIFPNQVRAAGQTIGVGTHWVFAALITLLTPVFLDANTGIFKENPWPIFVFFAAFMGLQLIFGWFYMPETKGKTLEEVEQSLIAG
ncbi:MAG: sugar porter family MFS transporter [Saprospiraceae bacterium]|nr:sugar porter family MFS transporter [Saprospiraceae bacterium]